MRPHESFVEQPVRSLQTMLRVLAEDDSRNPTVVPDGIYGPSTMNAVASFQRRNGLPATGVADQRTWDVIVEHFEPALIRVDKAQPIEVLIDPGQVFKLGDSSPYIYLIQSMLMQLSRDHSMINPPGFSGIMDASTVQALTEFQKLSGLEENGELDKVSWKHLVLHFTTNVNHHAVEHRRKTQSL